MNIQSNINQLLGLGATVSTLYKHSPEGQKKSALKANQAKEQILKEQLYVSEKQGVDTEAKFSGRTDVTNMAGVVAAETKAEVYSELKDLYKERFGLDPTEENLQKITAISKRAEVVQQTAEAKQEAYNKTMERYKRARPTDGLQKAIQEGQVRMQNKQATEDFQRKVGVRDDTE